MDTLHANFARPIKGKYYLIPVDLMSKWPKVFCLNSISAKSAIESFKMALMLDSRFQSLITDNVSPFQSSEFSIFCGQKGVKHMFLSPYHRKSNGLAERF